MKQQVSTFREAYADGSQLHVSEAAREVMELPGQVTDQVGLLGDAYNKGMDPNLRIGINYWLPRTGALANLERPDRRSANAFLFPLFNTFAKFLYARRDEIFQGTKPVSIRALAFGPQAAKANTWHCDLTIDREEGYFLSRSLPGYGRMVVGIDSQLRGDVAANIKFADGEFIVRDVVPEVDDAREWEDLYRGYPVGATVVARESGSVIDIADPVFVPPEGSIRSFGSLVLTDQSCTTLHAGVAVPDTLRLSLQCFYEPDRPAESRP